nr:MAG TPA: hypothetical protein [Caudoviricetes sp.]
MSLDYSCRLYQSRSLCSELQMLHRQQSIRQHKTLPHQKTQDWHGDFLHYPGWSSVY